MPIRRIQHQSCGEHLLERGLVTIEGTLSIQTLQIDKARQGSTRIDKDRQGTAIRRGTALPNRMINGSCGGASTTESVTGHLQEEGSMVHAAAMGRKRPGRSGR